MATVSVIIPAYQSSTTIVDAIQSVFNQTIKRDLEVVVVDDGSTDGTEEVLRPWMGNITFLRQENQGSASARNRGIQHATGDIVAFLDADDLWLPEKLGLQLPLFEKNAKVGLVFGNLKYWSEGRMQPTTYFDLMPPARGHVFHELFATNFVPTSSTLVRRQVFQQVGFFDESFRIVQDYHLWLRIASLWEFDYVRDPVAIYRISSQQVSKNLVRASSLLLQVKEDIYRSNSELFDGMDRRILERGLYNKYLRLVFCYIREAQKEEASQVLDRYRQVRGISIFYVMLRVLLKLPKPFMLHIVRIWDRMHQKPELGFY
jgi:glycosyltransferase involved in cell wall biosynthesis